MRSRIFEEMRNEYIRDPRFMEDLPKRNRMLSKFDYSIIVEGGDLELLELETWIKLNIGENSVNCVYYPKTGYDYLFVEYFFTEKNDLNNVSQAIPNIYTVYPSGHKFKTDGYDKFIDYEGQQ